MSSVQLSVVIITKNEEENIGRCLDAVAEIADEIVVVDSFSTDRTEEICRAKGTRFIQQAFLGHIEQKNFALAQASFHHVLSLDADEEVSTALKDSILLAKADWTADGYTMNRLNNYCGKWIRHSGWYPDRKLRLLDRRQGEWGGVNPHDRIKMHPGTTIKHLTGDLLHYSYKSIKEHVQRTDIYTDIMAAALHQSGKKATWIKCYANPGFTFFKNYILKRGILDGYFGFVVCYMTAYYTFLKYAKLRELELRERKKRE